MKVYELGSCVYCSSVKSYVTILSAQILLQNIIKYEVLYRDSSDTRQTLWVYDFELIQKEDSPTFEIGFHTLQ